jgi:hypothetical protein
MMDPDEVDLVDATIDWARKHGQENRRVLTLTHGEWLRIWFAAWLHSLSRALSQFFSGADA